MDSAIKTLGLFSIRLTLHGEVTKQIIVNIARSLEEAKTQLQSGKAVISNLDEDDNLEIPAAQLYEENTKTSDADDSIADDSILDDTQDTE